ncbi:hypothetical protein [Vreelandella populi]|uniref:hypothetical protein n=1 Tax=Vreelandella populi TaxID=2498858 RepID=UPI000F8D18C6|nr:hypothetical protein [Halomonas populi]RUR54269.1 hypothetical protein ELY40_08110 [Halomonas populi]
MLFKDMVKKAGVLGISFGLIASPLAFAHDSIELNKDRAVGSDVIDKPHSSATSSARYSASELNHGERDRMNTNYTPTSHQDQDGNRRQNTNSYQTSDLTRDEGDGTDW